MIPISLFNQRCWSPYLFISTQNFNTLLVISCFKLPVIRVNTDEEVLNARQRMRMVNILVLLSPRSPMWIGDYILKLRWTVHSSSSTYPISRPHLYWLWKTDWAVLTPMKGLLMNDWVSEWTNWLIIYFGYGFELIVDSDTILYILFTIFPFQNKTVLWLHLLWWGWWLARWDLGWFDLRVCTQPRIVTHILIGLETSSQNPELLVQIWVSFVGWIW